MCQDAKDANLMSKWDPHPSRGPLISFLLLKNKMEEDDTVPPDKRLKFRVVFGHLSHPLKQYGKQIGRCISLLVNEAAHVLKILELVTISDAKAYAEQLPKNMVTQSPTGFTDKGAAWLWELDVQGFFPSLDRTRS